MTLPRGLPISMVRRLKPLAQKLASAALQAKDATVYWFSRLTRLWLAACIFLALLSALIFFFAPQPRSRFYLSFPDSLSGRSRGEIRYAPYYASREKMAQSICRELILGPQDLRGAPLFSKDTKVRSVLIRRGVLYVDLSSELVFGPSFGGSYRKSLLIMEKTLKKNLPGQGKIVLTVDGNEAYADNSEEKPGESVSSGASGPSSQAR